MGRLLRILGACVMVGYPILVWRGLETQSPRRVALVLLAVLVPVGILRMRYVLRHANDDVRERTKENLRGLAALPLVSIGALAVASAMNSLGMILVVPAFVNAVMFVLFAWTLRAGSAPIVERFARLQDHDLDDEQVAWCRGWTKLWCAFFLFNGSIAGLTAALAPLSVWAFYNGLVAYALIGTMFATEWILRHRRFPQLRAGRASASEVAE